MTMVRSLLAALVLAGSTLGAQAPEGHDAYTTANVRLRKAPTSTAGSVTTIPRGTRVSVASCGDRWCAVGYRAAYGFVPQRYLVDDSIVVRQQGTTVRRGGGYVNSRGEWVPSPSRTANGQAPAGASAQCRDSSYSFSRSHSGTCSWHGGVLRWLR